MKLPKTGSTILLLALLLPVLTYGQTLEFPKGEDYDTQPGSKLRIPFAVSNKDNESPVIVTFSIIDPAGKGATDYFVAKTNRFELNPFSNKDTLVLQMAAITPPPRVIQLKLKAVLKIGTVEKDTKYITVVIDTKETPLHLITEYENCFQSAVKDVKIDADCEDNAMVLPETFNLLSQDLFSKLAPDITGDNTQGSGVSLTLDDKDSKISAQGAIKTSERAFVLLGVNTTMTNVGELFSGKSGIKPGWGGKLGFSYRIKNGLYYEKGECQPLQLRRNMYLDSMYRALEKTGIFEYDTIKARYDKYREDFNNLRGQLNYLQFEAYNTALDSLQKYNKLKNILEDIYGSDSMTKTRKQRNIKKYVRDKAVAFEKNNAKWTGYWLLYLTGNVYYESKNYGTYSEIPTVVEDRFGSQSFNKMGLKGSINYLRQKKTYLSLNLGMGTDKRTTFDLPQNQKYYLTYQKETIIPEPDLLGNLYEREEKNAYNTDSVQYDDFFVFFMDSQYTMLFGANKNFGFNMSASYSYSERFNTMTRLDFQGGPVFAVPKKEDESSLFTVGFYMAFRDILADKLSKEKFSVGVFTRIPISLIKY